MQTHQHRAIMYSLQCVYQFLLQQLASLPQQSPYRVHAECKQAILELNVHQKGRAWNQFYRKSKLLRLIRFGHCPLNTTPVTVEFQIGMKIHWHQILYQPQHLHHVLLLHPWFLKLHDHHKGCTRHQFLRQSKFLRLIFGPQTQLITRIIEDNCYKSLWKNKQEGNIWSGVMFCTI